MLYAVKNASELNADLVIQTDDQTVYICYLNPGLLDKSAGHLPYEEQNAWKIERVQTIVSEGVSYCRTMYPNGQNNLYNFNPAHVEEYTYEYQM